MCERFRDLQNVHVTAVTVQTSLSLLNGNQWGQNYIRQQISKAVGVSQFAADAGVLTST